jgi:hypothetical protein
VPQVLVPPGHTPEAVVPLLLQLQPLTTQLLPLAWPQVQVRWGQRVAIRQQRLPRWAVVVVLSLPLVLLVLLVLVLPLPLTYYRPATRTRSTRML